MFDSRRKPTPTGPVLASSSAPQPWRSHASPCSPCLHNTTPQLAARHTVSKHVPYPCNVLSHALSHQSTILECACVISRNFYTIPCLSVSWVAQGTPCSTRSTSLTALAFWCLPSAHVDGPLSVMRDILNLRGSSGCHSLLPPSFYDKPLCANSSTLARVTSHPRFARNRLYSQTESSVKSKLFPTPQRPPPTASRCIKIRDVLPSPRNPPRAIAMTFRTPLSLSRQRIPRALLPCLHRTNWDATPSDNSQASRRRAIQ
ncbi:hypothetical protein Tco_0633832 [Tanacetum coccineum]